MGSAVGAGLTVARARPVGRGRRPRESLCACRLLGGAFDRAFAGPYGVAAINIVNDLTVEAVLATAVEERSPVVIQTSSNGEDVPAKRALPDYP
jgi:hypothetical protein